MSTALMIAASAAQGEWATLFVGFELSKSTWLIGLYAPELGATVSRHKVDGGDLSRAQTLIEAAKRRLEKAGKPVRVVSIYEAGYDGFWLHRALQMTGVENRVIDAASMPVDRREQQDGDCAVAPTVVADEGSDASLVVRLQRRQQARPWSHDAVRLLRPALQHSWLDREHSVEVGRAQPERR